MKETVKIIMGAEALSDIINCGENAGIALMTMMLILDAGGYYVTQSFICNNPIADTDAEEVELGFQTLLDLGYIEESGMSEDDEMMYSVINGIDVDDPHIPFR